MRTARTTSVFPLKVSPARAGGGGRARACVGALIDRAWSDEWLGGEGEGGHSLSRTIFWSKFRDDFDLLFIEVQTARARAPAPAPIVEID